ncbi:MAG: hypothetical protein HRU15_10025 [Planctomycetes bacterium]|nr:hypothetical protein [Planctomycetota bacterium]
MVSKRSPGYVRFDIIHDSSHIAHWLDWQYADVRYQQTNLGLQVSWTMSYTRKCDPDWYFGPLQRYFVGLMCEYLITAHS